MFGLAPSELIVVAIVAVLLFGSKLPDVARNMGRSYHDFKKSMTDIQEQFRKAENEFRRPLDQPKAIGSQIAKEEDFEKPTSPKFTPPA